MRKFGFFQNSRSTLLSWQKGLSTLAKDAITKADSPVLLNPNYPPNGGDGVIYDSSDRTWKPLPVADKDGWIPVYETWTYYNTTTVDVPPDPTTRFQKGDMIRLKQGSTYKYFYIRKSSIGAASRVVLQGGDVYSLVNANITDIWISRANKPLDFPVFMVWDNFSVYRGMSSISSQYGRFSVFGGNCHLAGNVTGTSNENYLVIQVPFDRGSFGYSICGTAGNLIDNGTLITTPSVIWDGLNIGGSPTYNYADSLVISADGTGTGVSNWTNSGTKQAYFNITYCIY